MFNARTNARRYLNLIEPWTSGDWSEEKLASPAFAEEMTDMSRIVFFIPDRELPDWFEALLLGPDATAHLFQVIGWVTRCNEAIQRYNMTFYKTERLGPAIVAHRAVRDLKAQLADAKAVIL